MHVYFSGIGGVGIGPLAIIAKEAGHQVSGSDKQMSHHIKHLQDLDIKDVVIGQDSTSISQIHNNNPIDWLVYSSAVVRENLNPPELEFASQEGIRISKRDEFINEFLKQSNQKMIAVAGTHGKSTTTAMLVWLFKQLKIPVSYLIGAEISFGEMAHYNNQSKYFIYEADEYDHNFLSFAPEMSVITGIGYDHPDIYTTKEEYCKAFESFIGNSGNTIIWHADFEKLNSKLANNIQLLKKENLNPEINLPGRVNKLDAQLALSTLELMNLSDDLGPVQLINIFPGVMRRFEKISENIYSDYAHTPEKILGALQVAYESTNGNVIVVYEGLHNTRQHFIKSELKDLFKGIKKLYVVPSYLAREDESLELLTPEKLTKIIQNPSDTEPAKLNENLKKSISKHAKQGDLVLCLSAGGSGSLDEWLRHEF